MRHTAARALAARLLLISAGAGLLAVTPAGANSIASVVVRPDGEILFSDWARNRIWRFGLDRRLRVVAPDKHTHHLALGSGGLVFFEHVTPDGSVASLWSVDLRGTAREVSPPRRRPDPEAYEGTVFEIGEGNELFFLRDCQLVRRLHGGSTRPWAGTSCGEAAWKDDKVRYGHLHGSLAWGPAGTIYFSDTRTIRRVSREGAVSALDGRRAGLFGAPLPGEPAYERIMGLAADADGSVCFTLREDRTIRRVSPAGRVTTVARIRGSWTPTGLTLADGALYVLVEPRFPPLRAVIGGVRLLKISPSGRIEVLVTAR